MSTDPTSSNFDPLKALYAESKEKIASVKIYDNVATFEANLNRQCSKNKDDKVKKNSASRASKSFSQNKKILEEAETRDLSQLKKMMETRKKQDAINHWNKPVKEGALFEKKPKVQKNIFTSMEALQQGPMKMLYEFVNNRQRCHVYVRNFCRLRGVLVGLIVSFDRFMNLVMVDVDETFCNAPQGKVQDHQLSLSISQLKQVMKPSQIGERKADTSVEKPSRKPGSLNVIRLKGKRPRHDTFHGGYPQLYQRHLPQIFVRGNSIVLISNNS